MRKPTVVGNIGTVIAVAAALLLCGCSSTSIHNERLAKYRPSIADRNPGKWPVDTPREAPRDDNGPRNQKDKHSTQTLKVGDPVKVFLLDIPEPEEIEEMIDELGNVSLSLIGVVKITGLTTGEAESLIQKEYIVGEFYKKITVVVVTQLHEYYVGGEVIRPGKYPLTGGITLLQAIITAGDYTPFARRTKIKIIRRGKVLFFNGKKIQAAKAPDPPIEPQDKIEVLKKWL